jgi:hypothetical protein
MAHFFLVAVHAEDWCQRFFYGTQNVSSADLCRTLGENVSTTWPKDAVDQAGTAQFGKQLGQVVAGQLLPFGNVLAQDGTLILVQGKVYHSSQGVPAQGGQSHSVPSV